MTDTTKKPDYYAAAVALESLCDAAGILEEPEANDADLADRDTLAALAHMITAAARTLALYTGATSPTLAAVLGIDGPAAR